MGIQFDVEIRSNCVCLSCSGEFTVEDFLNAIKTGLAIAADNEAVALLVDIRDLEGDPPSTMQRFNMGAAVPDLQREHPTLINIAVVGKEPMIDPKRFGETVAVNRGAFGKVFTDIDEANMWLRDRIDKNYL